MAPCVTHTPLMKTTTNKATETKAITVEVITGNPELDFLLSGGNPADLPPYVPSAEEVAAEAKAASHKAWIAEINARNDASAIRSAAKYKERSKLNWRNREW